MNLRPDTLKHQPIEIFCTLFNKRTIGSLIFLLPLEISVPLQKEIEEYIELVVSTTQKLLQINPDTKLTEQYIVFCDPDLYWKRFEEKAEKYNFDPKPWSWSEGDIDFIEPFGKVFCIKLSAGFRSESEKHRFAAHELAHPIISQRAPIIGKLLADTEGIVEAEARIGLEIQLNSNYQYSTDFILSLTSNQLVLPEEINRIGYDHPAFYGKQVSENPGYASCFLWFFGLCLLISNYSGVENIKEKYLEGRETIITIANKSQSLEEYKNLFLEIGIKYDELAKSMDFLLNAQNTFRLFVNG